MNWRYAYTALVLCTLAFTATMVSRLVISPVVPRVTDAFGVTNAAVGLALSGMWAAYSLTQFPSGVLGDRYGEARIILAAVALSGAGSLLLALSPSFPLFAAFAVVLGVGAGLHYTVATTYLAKQFDDIGRAIGFHVAGGPVAGLLAPPAAVALAVRFGWRPALLLGAAVAIPTAALFAWRIRPTEPDRPDQPMRERFEPGAVFELLSRPSIAYTAVLAVFGAFTWQATASFLPTFFVEGRDLSAGLASALFSGYFVVHGATQPITGWLSDLLDRDAAAALTMSSGVAGFGLLVVGAGLPAYALGTAMAGLAMSWGAPVQSRFMDHLSDDERGAGFGLVRTVYMTTGATGSVAVGALADAFGWGAAFGVLAGLMGLGLVVLATNRLLGLGL